MVVGAGNGRPSAHLGGRHLGRGDARRRLEPAITFPQVSDGPVFGAAIQASVGTGIYPDLQTAVEEHGVV